MQLDHSKHTAPKPFEWIRLVGYLFFFPSLGAGIGGGITAKLFAIQPPSNFYEALSMLMYFGAFLIFGSFSLDQRRKP
jgi:hypothetical protein